MPWVRLDDDHYDDPRIIDLSLEAVGLLHLGLIWACRHLTDGWVADAMLRNRAGRGASRIISELMTRGLLTACAQDARPGYRIADDLVALQPTREQVQRDRLTATARQQRHRLSRRDTPVTDAVTRTEVTVASHDPVPSRPVQSPKDQVQEQAAPPRAHRQKTEEELKPNGRVLTALVHDVIDKSETPDDLSELSEEAKTRAARAGLVYDSNSIGKAFRSAVEQRRREGARGTQ